MINERKAKVGDKIVVTHTEGYEISPVTLTIAKIDSNNDFFTEEYYRDHRGDDHFVVLNSYNYDGLNDTWHFADEYDDEQLPLSYREAARKGATLADYTGVDITPESLAFKSDVDKTIEGITPSSLAFKEVDAVNHPTHYNTGKFETIEIIEAITSGYGDGYIAYCVGNALKYLARAPHKHATPTEDMNKAAKYLEFAIEYINEKETI